MSPLEPVPAIARNARRFETIIATLARYGLADWIPPLPSERLRELARAPDGRAIPDLAFAERVRMAITELGTTFIKLGQVLSTRPDLVGIDLATELTSLQADTPADGPEVVCALITAELGRPPEELFATFEPTAFRSASIAQVHHATLPGGRRVVVKVQHSGIEESVHRDLDILAFLAGLAEKHSKELRLYRPRALVSEFRRTILRELDFERERRNLIAFGNNFQHDPSVRFPRPYAEVSSTRVLTMDFLDGTSIREVDALAEQGVDLEAVAWNGATVFAEMVFRDGFYHADPHPGNLLVLPGGVVGLIDCGMAGRIDQSTREDLEGFLYAAVKSEPDEMMRHFLWVGSTPRGLDGEQLRREVTDFVEDYGQQSLVDLDLTQLLEEIISIVHRHRIVLQPSVSLLLRMLILLEGSARTLDRDFSLAELLQPYVERRVLGRYAPVRVAKRLQRSSQQWLGLVENLPRELSDLFDRVKQGTFDVHLDHRRLDSVVNRLAQGILAAALFVSSAMLWSTQSPPSIRGISIFGALGALAATWLSYRLLRAIHRSGGIGSSED